MNEHAILHIPDTQYCFPLDSEHMILRLRLMRGEVLRNVSVLYACKYDFAEERKEALMVKKYSDRLFDYYEAELVLTDVRLAYVFYISTEADSYYYSEDGLTQSYNFEMGFYNFFQMPYIHCRDTIKTVEWMKNAVFYQIFVDRFHRGDYEKDGSYINLKWGDIPDPKSFAGGDLKGIIQKLDYLKALSVNTIYLTPVFSAVSNHKYDIHDYYSVDKQFGSNEDLKELIQIAHQKGMRIVLDAVFNHCSSLTHQFQDVLKKGKSSQYFHWFIIKGEKPDQGECNYECFASCEYMPKLNTDNEEVCSYLLDIARYWVKEFDIDGWRLDVSDEISHDFWRRFRKTVKEEKKDCVIIGENWHDANSFLRGDQYDSIMNYAFTKACLDYFAFDSFTAGEFAGQLNGLLMRNKKPVNEMMLNLLDSHDTHRFFTQVKKDKDKMLAALAVETCFPGVPCIYYGTEICLEGGYDPDCRRTFDWEEVHWDREFMDMVTRILKLKSQRALKEGEVSIEAVEDVFILKRIAGDEQITIFYNGGNGGIQVPEETAENNILLAHLWEDSVLQPGGFVIRKIQ